MFIEVSKLDRFKLFGLQVRKFNLELRLTHWVDPNRCLAEDLLFFAVLVVDAHANLYPSRYMVRSLVFKDSLPANLSLIDSRTSFSRGEVWEI